MAAMVPVVATTSMREMALSRAMLLLLWIVFIMLIMLLMPAVPTLLTSCALMPATAHTVCLRGGAVVGKTLKARNTAPTTSRKQAVAVDLAVGEELDACNQALMPRKEVATFNPAAGETKAAAVAAAAVAAAAVITKHRRGAWHP